MVKLSAKVSFDIKLERKLWSDKVTTRTISKVLRVAKQTIRTHLRKMT